MKIYLSKSKFKRACTNACKELRALAPKDTGNLAYNAIKIEFPNENECHIYVDESIAPYMPFTTRPWISSRWHGKKNPNEGWWQSAGELLAEYVAAQVGGKLSG